MKVNNNRQIHKRQQHFKEAKRMGSLEQPVEMTKIMAFMVSDNNAYMSNS